MRRRSIAQRREPGHFLEDFAQAKAKRAQAEADTAAEDDESHEAHTFF
jgi:hypothetical protein